MRIAVFVLIVIICVSLSCGVFAHFGLFGTIPDLLICFLISIALFDKSIAVLFMATVAGLLFDIRYGGAWGMFAIPYLIIAVIIFFVSTRFKISSKILMPAIFGFMLFLIKDSLCMLLSFLFGNSTDMVSIFIRYSIPGAAITGVLTPAIYLLTRTIFQIQWFRKIKTDDFRNIK